MANRVDIQKENPEYKQGSQKKVRKKEMWKVVLREWSI